MTPEEDDAEMSRILEGVIGTAGAAIVNENTPKMRALIAEAVDAVKAECERVGLQSSDDFAIYATFFQAMQLMDDCITTLVYRLGPENPANILNNFGLQVGSFWLAAKSAKEMSESLLNPDG